MSSLTSFIFAVGRFIKNEFDKFILLAILVWLIPHLSPGENSQEFIKQVITGALSALYGYMQGSKRPTTTVGVNNGDVDARKD